jgi:hypothetical protein
MSQESRPKPYQPRGSVDAKVGSSTLCNEMKFLARWGNACGTPFNKNEFCDKHGQWDYQRPFLEDRPEEPWVVCSSITVENESELDNAIKVYHNTETSISEEEITPSLHESESLLVSPPSNTVTSDALQFQPELATEESSSISQQPPTSNEQLLEQQLNDESYDGGNTFKKHKSRKHKYDERLDSNGGKNQMKEFMNMVKQKNKKNNNPSKRNNNTKRNKKSYE